MRVRRAHLVVVFLVIVAGVVWHLLGSERDLVLPRSGTTIVAFGDSLVAGAGTTDSGDFVSLLAARTQTEIVNLGVPGDTTKKALLRIDDLLGQDPRVVILLLGGNDALQHAPVDATFQNLEVIIKAIQEYGAGIVLVGAPGGLYGTRYEKEYERLADTYGLAFVPNILKGLLGRPEYMADAVHPNNDGHVIMADRIEPELKKLIGSFETN